MQRARRKGGKLILPICSTRYPCFEPNFHTFMVKVGHRIDCAEEPHTRYLARMRMHPSQDNESQDDDGESMNFLSFKAKVTGCIVLVVVDLWLRAWGYRVFEDGPTQ